MPLDREKSEHDITNNDISQPRVPTCTSAKVLSSPLQPVIKPWT
jgi:hypothetical protein